jgi:hypothetical protein
MVRCRLVLAWLAAAAVAHGKEIKRIHGDDPSIYEDRVMSESDRVAKFHELHGEWPDPRWLARETPGYTRRMAEREADIMADATTSQARWDQWMFLVQARMLPTFTPQQWTKTKAPADVYERLITRFREKIQSATRESMSQDLSGVLGPEHALFFEQVGRLFTSGGMVRVCVGSRRGNHSHASLLVARRSLLAQTAPPTVQKLTHS